MATASDGAEDRPPVATAGEAGVRDSAWQGWWWEPVEPLLTIFSVKKEARSLEETEEGKRGV